ncbi:MAG TPA: VanZ family protein [Candidatus Dietzia intestinigallinarum]|nr:VanZ family protein [Candidatus Dietzia intestinigallinarum]
MPTRNRRTHLVGLSSVKELSSTRLRAWAAAALIAYGAVVVALSMLKAFFVIGMLWRTEAQRNRSIEWEPFALYRNSTTWFGPLFDYLGNMAFFVPVGVLLFILLEHRRRAMALVVVVAALSSATVETLQYLFALGHSDVSDLLFNTLGALVGAVIAHLGGRRLHPLWIGLALTTAAVFAVLVILGPRLGDPDKVVDVARPARTAGIPEATAVAPPK